MNPILGVLGSQQGYSPNQSPSQSHSKLSNQRANKSIVEQFREFKSQFKGNPQAEIDRLVREGKVTKQQVNEATQLASMLKSMIKNNKD